MPLHAELTRDVRHGAKGSKIGAFFDMDHTLLAGFSSVMFFRERLLTGKLAPRDLFEALSAVASFQLGRIGFSGLVTGALGMLRGMAESTLEELGEHIFDSQIARSIYPEARSLVEAHRRMGHTLAIVSSATRFQIEPLARELGIEHVLCTRLEVRGGVFTGRIVPPACYGEGKAEAAREIAILNGLDLNESYFYTDSEEDLPLLEQVGHPVPTNPTRRLATIAAERGWTVRRFRSRGTPGLEDLVRTGLAIGSIVPSFLLGIPVGILNRTRRQTVNLGLSAFGELATALAGLDLRVEGEPFLWTRRPAVFIFNHQSHIDPLLMCKLLRRDVVGVAPPAARWNPVYGPLLALSGALWIDDRDGEAAEADLEAPLQALHEGLSLVLAPEGSRRPTPRLGPFRRLAFRIARRAQVPVIPIVLRNTLDALPLHARVIRPATIEIVVHPPQDTTVWTEAGLDREIARMEQLYADSLAT